MQSLGVLEVEHRTLILKALKGTRQFQARTWATSSQITEVTEEQCVMIQDAVHYYAENEISAEFSAAKMQKWDITDV